MTTATNFSKKTAALIAAFLTIFAMLSVNATPAHAAAGTISGFVKESIGTNRISGATVTVTSAGTPADTATVTTPYNGSFYFSTSTLPGHSDYTITVSKAGYATQTFTGVNNSAGNATQDVLLVTSTAAGTISGTVNSVVAAGTTTAVSGANVYAIRGGVSTDFVWGTTDANGAYSLSVPAGSYVVQYSAGNNVEQYSGGSSTLAAATAFDVASGASITKNVNLVQQGRVSGTTTPGGVTVTVRKTDGTTVTSVTSAAGATGAYEVTQLDPGAYYLQYSTTGYVTEYWNDSANFLGSTAVTVTSGGNTTAISPTLIDNAAATTAGTVSATSVTASISGNPIEGQTLTASTSGWTTSGTVVNYQWQISTDNTTFTNITDAILSTYTVLASDYNKYIRVQATGSKLGWISSSAVTSSATAQVTHAFVTKPTPTITGTPALGQTLTAVTGTWSPIPDSFTYQWYYGGAIVPGATASTLEITNFVAGYAITVAVTAVKSGYPSTAMTSLATAVVGQLMTVTPTPTISGTAAIGRTLTVVTGSWTPSNVSFTYQWYRSGSAISGAIGSTYAPVAADVGYYLTVTVVAAATNYTSTTLSSASTSIVLNKITTATPTISGSTTIGSVLTVSPGTWSPAASLTYQWYRSGTAISGATASTYTLVQADDTTTITVTVSGTYSGYETASATSAGFLVGKQFTSHPTPTVKGNTYLGQTLTATVGTWDTGATLSFQWLRNGVAITNAKARTYKLVAADVGTRITFTATATASGFVPKTETSAATAVILNGKPFTKAPTPTISGNARVGANLTANLGVWSPAPTKVTYQWLRGGVAITGATKSTYKATSADKGYFLSVRIVATKSGFATTTKVSKLTLSIK